MIDTAIFDEYPQLRKIIGNHGDPVHHVRPVNDRTKLWCKENSNCVAIRSWVIYDHEGWKRDLVPCEVVSNKLKWYERAAKLELKSCLCGYPKGVVFDVPLLGLFALPFRREQGPTVTHNTLTLTYCLEFYGGKQPCRLGITRRER